ncbi:unnamed protein product [Mucor circinelloides]
MTMPNPMYTASPMYASPAMPQMASAAPYYNGPSPYTPVMAAQQTPGYYPPMGAMQVGGGPVMAQQPYPVVYQRNGCCCDCCYGDCSCCLGIFATLCLCCCCCGDEADECC